MPTSFKVKLFKCFLDAAVSEQVARMTAMKAATDNANKIIKKLSMSRDCLEASQRKRLWYCGLRSILSRLMRSASVPGCPRCASLFLRLRKKVRSRTRGGSWIFPGSKEIASQGSTQRRPECAFLFL